MPELCHELYSLIMMQFPKMYKDLWLIGYIIYLILIVLFSQISRFLQLFFFHILQNMFFIQDVFVQGFVSFDFVKVRMTIRVQTCTLQDWKEKTI